jgi:hypothetical protein
MYVLCNKLLQWVSYQIMHMTAFSGASTKVIIQWWGLSLLKSKLSLTWFHNDTNYDNHYIVYYHFTYRCVICLELGSSPLSTAGNMIVQFMLENNMKMTVFFSKITKMYLRLCSCFQWLNCSLLSSDACNNNDMFCIWSLCFWYRYRYRIGLVT